MAGKQSIEADMSPHSFCQADSFLALVGYLSHILTWHSHQQFTTARMESHHWLAHGNAGKKEQEAPPHPCSKQRDNSSLL